MKLLMLNRIQGRETHATGKMARGNAEVKPILRMHELFRFRATKNF